MRNVNELLSEYAVSHQNRTNKLIHYYCVPLIMFSIIGILMNVSLLGTNLGFIVIVLALFYYLSLSVKYFALMVPILTVMYLGNMAIAQITNLLIFSLVLFVISWAFQFIGHKIEGKKPSFLDDLLFLLVGPMWVAKSLFKLH